MFGRPFAVIGDTLINVLKALDATPNHPHLAYPKGSPTLLEHTKMWHDMYLFLDLG